MKSGSVVPHTYRSFMFRKLRRLGQILLDSYPRGCRPHIFMLRMRVLSYSIYRRLFLARTGQKKISFCISTMNRYEEISRTLPENLRNNARFAEDIEFVLVNFINGPEGLKTDRWVRDNFPDEIKSGYLKYFVTDKMPHFHMSVAKNTTHINASGLYLFNLDGDNYIGSEETGGLLNQCIYDLIAHLWSGTWHDGSHGRIGIGAYEFLALHGYNESLLPKTYQDIDLLQKCIRLLGKKVFLQSEENRTLRPGHHGKKSRIKAIYREDAEEKKAIQGFALSRLENTEPGRGLSSELKAKKLLQMMDEKNRMQALASTKNYTRVFKQEKIGVEVTAVTADNLDSFFLTYEDAAPKGEAEREATS